LGAVDAKYRAVERFGNANIYPKVGIFNLEQEIFNWMI
jgi:hypothetical protein